MITYLAFRSEEGFQKYTQYIGKLGTVNENDKSSELNIWYRIYVKIPSGEIDLDKLKSDYAKNHSECKGRIESMNINQKRGYAILYLSEKEDFFYWLKSVLMVCPMKNG